MITTDEVRKAFEYRDGGLYWRVPIKYHAEKLGKRVGSVAGGYRQLEYKGKPYREHRLIWLHHGNELLENQEIDHINGNRLDNRIENLRQVDRATNQKNKHTVKSNTGHKGLSFYKCRTCPGCKVNNSIVLNITSDKKKYHWYLGHDLKKAIEFRNQKYEELGFHKNHYLTPIGKEF